VVAYWLVFSSLENIKGCAKNVDEIVSSGTSVYVLRNFHHICHVLVICKLSTCGATIEVVRLRYCVCQTDL